MKIKTEHYEHLARAIVPLDTELRREAYRAGAFHNSDKVKDLDKRYRWDLLYAARISTWLCDTLYTYMDDSHIDTALRQIVRPLKLTPLHTPLPHLALA